MNVAERYMKQAIRLAGKAAELGEVPIGCIIEYQGKVIGRGYNRRTTDKSTLAHAEIIAIKKACKKMGDWRLEDCTMYVTLEPCQMCAGAIVQARVKKVVIGCMNPKAGCAGSILNVLQMEEFNHQVQIERGVLEDECSKMLTAFFKDLRKRLKGRKEENKKASV
jgi:tRNA(adenine34) deaminase